MDKMNTELYRALFCQSDKKIFALLIDPGNQTSDVLKRTIETANISKVDVILVGGSLTSQPIDETLDLIKGLTKIPMLLFPGNLMQISPHAQGLLLLSLLSGRNPEYLIGNHVLASQYLKKTGLEIIPTGYILIDGHTVSAVEYISNTRPIPAEKTDIITATALAGEQLGLKLIYLEAGSGAQISIRAEIVRQVKETISIPFIVGGGIRTPDDIRCIYQAGANGVVVGTAVEEDYNILKKIDCRKG